MGTILELCRVDDIYKQPGAEDLRKSKTSDTVLEDWLQMLIQAFSTGVEERCHRELLLDERTQVLDVTDEQQVLRLRAYPVTAIAEVRESLTGDFSNVTPLDPTLYGLRQGGRRGQLKRRWGCWWAGTGTTQVKYTGGLAQNTDLVPADLRMAAALQCTFVWKQNPTMHLRSQGMSEGSATFFEGKDLLPSVAACLERYTRKSF